MNCTGCLKSNFKKQGLSGDLVPLVHGSSFETMVKQTPDRILKGMVLSAIEQGNSTTAEIRNHLATVPYFYESSEIDGFENPTNSEYYIYSNYGGLRRELTYLRHQGYIRKLGKKPPHRFEPVSYTHLTLPTILLV